MSRKTYFNENANRWDNRFCTPKLASFLENFVPLFGLTFGQNVLDVGTGTGILIPYLIQAVGPDGTVTAIDYSEKMVNVCKIKHSNIKNVNIHVGNIEEDQFTAQSFDAVICFGVFPHLENKQKALQNMNCTLKHYGKLVIAHALSSEEIKTHHKDSSLAIMHDMLPQRTRLVQLLEQTGFTQISIKDEPGFYLCISHKT